MFSILTPFEAIVKQLGPRQNSNQSPAAEPQFITEARLEQAKKYEGKTPPPEPEPKIRCMIFFPNFHCYRSEVFRISLNSTDCNDCDLCV
jgi:hypothetical protein